MPRQQASSETLPTPRMVSGMDSSTQSIDDERRWKAGETSGARGSASDPAAETQYLHYKFDESRLRYATDIGKEELLKHDGDVAISVALSQYRPGNGETHMRASQLRVDTTQIHPLMKHLRAHCVDLDRFTYASKSTARFHRWINWAFTRLRQHKGQTRFY